jgi:hypothetical protein
MDRRWGEGVALGVRNGGGQRYGMGEGMAI